LQLLLLLLLRCYRHRERINQLICTFSTKGLLLLPCVHFQQSGKLQQSNKSYFWIFCNSDWRIFVC
jgi:hypothetical protein